MSQYPPSRKYPTAAAPTTKQDRDFGTLTCRQTEVLAGDDVVQQVLHIVRAEVDQRLCSLVGGTLEHPLQFSTHHLTAEGEGHVGGHVMMVVVEDKWWMVGRCGRI